MSDLRVDGKPVGKVTECLIDYDGPAGRLMAMREEHGVPIVSGKMEVILPLEPNSFVVSRRWFYRLARSCMTRRGFRRWRARNKRRSGR